MIFAATWESGALLAAVIALTAWRLGTLTRSGALAAWLVGTVAMSAGWSWGILLVLYFLSSAVLSRWRAREKAQRMGGRVEKTGARDAWQVAANGGFYAVAALGHCLEPDPRWQVLGLGALGASAADTWATEIGSLARGQPRSIVTGRSVPPGTSGGITTLGLAASLAAAVVLAAAATALGWPRPIAIAGVAGALAGALTDSMTGAAIQARYWCDACGEETERRVHACGNTTTWHGGVRWLDNDGVNAVATGTGMVVAFLAWWAIA